MNSISRFLLLTIHTFLFQAPFAFSQQVTEGKSGNYSFSITKEIKPPILAILDETIQRNYGRAQLFPFQIIE